MIPRLATTRLVLDALTPDDVPAVVELAGHPDIFATTLKIPHPYSADDAQRWIASHLPDFLNDKGPNFAVRHDGKLVGTVGLIVNRKHHCGTLGYWIGREFWGQGYATEAVRAVIVHGFEKLQLEKIEAEYFSINPSSGRVMEKAGMTREGLRPHHYKKGENYIDAVLYGITRSSAVAAGLVMENAAGPPSHPPVILPKPRQPNEPPTAEELVAPGVSSMDRALVLRHFLGKTRAELEQELRVYGQSLARDFTHLAPGALSYYLKSAAAFLESDFAEGDWDFAHGLVAALAAQLRGHALPVETRELAQKLIRHIRDDSARYLIEARQQPFAGWVAEALTE